MLSRWRKMHVKGGSVRRSGWRRRRVHGAKCSSWPSSSASTAAQGGARAAKKSHSVLFRSKSAIFAFIAEEQDRFGVKALCRRYGVTRAGFYAWAARAPVGMLGAMSDCRTHPQSLRGERRNLGRPRIHAALDQAGFRAGSQAGCTIDARGRPQGALGASVSSDAGDPGVLQCDSQPVASPPTSASNQIWVGDVT